jgi:hypothetical protein
VVEDVAEAGMAIKGLDKMKANLAALEKKLGKADTLRVGFLEGATYPDGTSVPFVAAMDEFGNNYAPPRPFFRRMISEKSPTWPAAMVKVMKATDNDVVKSLNLMGEGIQGQLIQSINDFVSPGLAQSTIDRKGFDKPLIDTSVMVNSTGYEVK